MNAKKLNGFQLKLIAIVTMLIDHVGAVFFPGVELFRLIGRISFPLFCFLLVEGLYHTKNVYRYMGRLAALAVISEFFYDKVLLPGEPWWAQQNIFVTLLIGLIGIHLLRLIELKWKTDYVLQSILQIVVVLVALGLAFVCRVDYSFLGILYIFLLYLYRGHFAMIFLLMAVITYLCMGPSTQMFATAAVVLMALYNGERGRDMKYFFYAFYPVHLLIIGLIHYFIQ